MSVLHKHIIAIFLWIVAILYLDHFGYYYYFSGLVYGVEWLYLLAWIAVKYDGQKKNVIVSAALGSLFAFNVFSISQAVFCSVIYMQRLGYCLYGTENIIDQTQAEWLCFHYFISGLFAMFVFFYFIINWEKWLEV